MQKMVKAVKQIKPKTKENGFVLYEGPSMLDPSKDIVVIATLTSMNDKTGDMIQTWILVKDEEPHHATKTGADKIICGSCPHRHFNNGSCYVVVFRAPLNVYRSYKRGIYPKFDKAKHGHHFESRMLRLGAYGDPASVPFDVWKDPLSLSKKHTGYTHQIKHKNFDKRYLSICQVSADSPKQALKYQAMGAKTFRVTLEDDHLFDNEEQCKNETKGLNCLDCMECDGVQKNIAVTVHGSRRNNFKSNLIQVKQVA